MGMQIGIVYFMKECNVNNKCFSISELNELNFLTSKLDAASSFHFVNSF